ncbi:MAG: PASTA domain-containing protein [Marinilabiliales bacterium]|nr:PASTA domain-containing protein [Marinilabiliales bacterium]
MIKVTINAINPEMVAVPDLVGLPVRQALSVIKTAGLEIGQLDYVPDLTVDFVLKQTIHGRDVSPGDSVQKGNVIDLVLGRGLSSQRTNIPLLTGYTLERARSEVYGASLNLGAFVFDSTVQNNTDSLTAFVYKQIRNITKMPRHSWGHQFISGLQRTHSSCPPIQPPLTRLTSAAWQKQGHNFSDVQEMADIYTAHRSCCPESISAGGCDRFAA